MEKEIVIASFSDKINYIPEEWSSYTIIYKCIENNNHDLLSSFEDLRIKYYLNDDLNNLKVDNMEYYNEMNKFKELLDFFKEIYNELYTFSHAKTYSQQPPYKIINNFKLKYSGQWLNHIIWRYEQLADITIFLKDSFYKLHFIKNEIDNLTNITFKCIPDIKKFEPREDMEYKFIHDFKFFLPSVNFNSLRYNDYCYFAASKEVIRSRSKKFYIDLKDNLNEMNPSDSKNIEKIWWNIFGCPL